MPRSYEHIQDYEQEILELRKQGYSKREICEILGFSLKQLTNFITRYNTKQRKLAAGILPKKKGRPRKSHVLTEQDKDARIRQLEMENELLRDFLSLIEGM